MAILIQQHFKIIRQSPLFWLVLSQRFGILLTALIGLRIRLDLMAQRVTHLRARGLQGSTIGRLFARKRSRAGRLIFDGHPLLTHRRRGRLYPSSLYE